MGDEKEEMKEEAPTKEVEAAPPPVDAPQPEVVERKESEPEAESPPAA